MGWVKETNTRSVESMVQQEVDNRIVQRHIDASTIQDGCKFVHDNQIAKLFQIMTWDERKQIWWLDERDLILKLPEIARIARSV